MLALGDASRPSARAPQHEGTGIPSSGGGAARAREGLRNVSYLTVAYSFGS